MLAQAYQGIGQIVLLIVLLGFSAFFSGSETAFFNLSRRDIRSLRQSGKPVALLVVRLLAKPGQLLNCLLFGNMTVNVLYYATASVVILHVKQQLGLGAAAALGLVSFAALVLFGEILPKSIAYANSTPLASLAAIPAAVGVTVFVPLGWLFKYIIVEPVLRVLLGARRAPPQVTPAQLRSLVDTSRREGLLSEQENKLLTKVIELGPLRVRHVMQPRVDMPACSVADEPRRVLHKMLAAGLTKLPVYVQELDNIVGFVHARQLLLRPGVSIDRLVQKVHFVPEQKTVESLLEFFRAGRTDMAVVVDEYGGIAGSVCLEDIADELFGRTDVPLETEPIRQLGPFEYMLSGDLPIHDWAQVLDIDLAETRVATIGGLVIGLLGRIPKPGDVAVWGNLSFKVEQVQHRRVKTVRLTLGPIASDD